MVLSHEDGYIHSYEKKLFEKNRTYWDAVPNIKDGKKWIYAYHALPLEFDMALLEDVAAKGLQNKESLPIASVSYGSCPSCDGLDSSFGIDDIQHLNGKRYVNLRSRIRTYIEAKFASLRTYKKGKRLFALHYRGISCGDEIHDTIIREASFDERNGRSFGCFDVGREEYFRYIREAMSVIDWSFALFEKKRPAYVISTECIYTKGLFGSVAAFLGAKLITTSLETADILLENSRGKMELMTEKLQRKIENHLDRNPALKPETDNLFVLRTESNAQSRLLEQLGISNGKKNVFIMLHCLGDLPRGNRQYIYNGYAEWFLDTLRIIRTIKNVNWIVKEHPMASFFRQDKYVKSVFEKNRTENMYWCDKSVSGMDIKEIADCVVTCSGEVGLEYWAYGIPTITTSGAYFCGWGISYCMKSLEDYEAVLRNIEQLEPPPRESSLQAERYLAAARDMRKTEDELANLFMHERRKVLDGFMNQRGSRDGCRYELCKGYVEFLREKGIQSSSIYQLKTIYEL